MSNTQRRSTMRIPPFFRRLFKFTSMDFETVGVRRTPEGPAKISQAVWEMTHLIIAPKKVFRNIYYHVIYHSTSISTILKCIAEFLSEANKVNLPPSRPSIHLSALTLSLPHRSCLGSSLHKRCGSNPRSTSIRATSLSRNLTPREHANVLPRWPSPRETAARTVWTKSNRKWRGGP